MMATPETDSTPHARRLLFLAGPTAVGKSEVALQLAEELAGEIISVDSMQVYRGLNVGTAKPSPADQQRAPHHLIDVADLNEAFDAARFIHLAREAVSRVQERGHLPIFCGGTGLYFKAYLEGLGGAPGSDPRLRAELEARPIADLLNELSQVDPVSYQHIDRQNPRRVIRALEVIRLTGKPFSSQKARWTEDATSSSARSWFFILNRTSQDLQTRIAHRVDRMFECGLVEEVRHLLKQGLAQNRIAMQAIGYRQVVEHLRGTRSLPETVALVKSRTRQFARRQMTWFRHQANGQWIDLVSGESAMKAAQMIRDQFLVAG